jgi:hypothetical protein
LVLLNPFYRTRIGPSSITSWSITSWSLNIGAKVEKSKQSLGAVFKRPLYNEDEVKACSGTLTSLSVQHDGGDAML